MIRHIYARLIFLFARLLVKLGAKPIIITKEDIDRDI